MKFMSNHKNTLEMLAILSKSGKEIQLCHTHIGHTLGNHNGFTIHKKNEFEDAESLDEVEVMVEEGYRLAAASNWDMSLLTS